jgi:hypothetical protein
MAIKNFLKNFGVFCGLIQVWDMTRSLQGFYPGGRIGGF